MSNELAEFSRSEAYIAGYFAFEDGHLKDDNPYTDVIDALDWDCGWTDAQGFQWYQRCSNEVDDCMKG